MRNKIISGGSYLRSRLTKMLLVSSLALSLTVPTLGNSSLDYSDYNIEDISERTAGFTKFEFEHVSSFVLKDKLAGKLDIYDTIHGKFVIDENTIAVWVADSPQTNQYLVYIDLQGNTKKIVQLAQSYYEMIQIEDGSILGWERGRTSPMKVHRYSKDGVLMSRTDDILYKGTKYYDIRLQNAFITSDGSLVYLVEGTEGRWSEGNRVWVLKVGHDGQIQYHNDIDYGVYEDYTVFDKTTNSFRSLIENPSDNINNDIYLYEYSLNSGGSSVGNFRRTYAGKNSSSNNYDSLGSSIFKFARMYGTLSNRLYALREGDSKLESVTELGKNLLGGINYISKTFTVSDSVVYALYKNSNLKNLYLCAFDINYNLLGSWLLGSNVDYKFEHSTNFRFDTNRDGGSITGSYSFQRTDIPRTEIHTFKLVLPKPVLTISTTKVNNANYKINCNLVTNGNAIAKYEIYNTVTGKLHYSGAYDSAKQIYLDSGTHKLASRVLDSSNKVLATSNVVTVTVAGASVSLTTSNANIGDNTPHQFAISVNNNSLSLGTLKIYNANNTAEIFYNGPVVNTFSWDLGERNINFKADVYTSSNIHAGTSTALNISRVNLLNRTLSVAENENGLSKFVLLGDVNRYYEDNIINRAIVNKLKEKLGGIFIMQNALSPVLIPLMEK